MNILERYIKYFAEQSKYNRMYAILTFHAILGSLVRNLKIKVGKYFDDARVHVFYVADSGTGKSTGSNVFTPVVEALGMSIHPLDDFTDASMAGTMQQTEEEDPETGQIRIIREEAEGILELNDFIHSDEASLLLIPNKYSMKTVIFIQKACNPIGSASNRINRTLASGEIESEASCTFILTTFPPKRKREVGVMVENGLLQRMAFYPRSMDSQAWSKMSDQVIDGFFEDDEEITEEEYSVEFDTIAHVFSEIQKEYEDVDYIPIPVKFKTYVKGRKKRMFDYLDNHGGREDVKRVMRTYYNRYLTLMMKFATHSAVFNHRKRVEKEDLQYAWKLVFELFKVAHFWIEENLPSDYKTEEDRKASPHQTIYEAYESEVAAGTTYLGINEGYISKRDITRAVRNGTNYSTSWVNKELGELLNTKKAVKIKSGKSVYFKVTNPTSKTLKRKSSKPSKKKSKKSKKPIERSLVLDDDE